MGHEPNELPLVNSLDRPTPILRRELIFRLQTFGGKQCYVVEDPVTRSILPDWPGGIRFHVAT